MRVKSVNVLVRYVAVVLDNWLFHPKIEVETEISRDTPWAIMSEQLFQCIETFVADRSDRTIAQLQHPARFSQLHHAEPVVAVVLASDALLPGLDRRSLEKLLPL
jgi:hypothetical protein